MDTSKQKPDLMGSSRAAPDGAKRILAHLEHGARLPASKPSRADGWTVDGWTVGLGLLLLFMCGVAWLMHDNTITPGTRRADYSGAQRYQSRQESNPVAQAPVTREPSGQTAQAEQAAAIVNDPYAQAPATASTPAGAVVASSSSLPAPKANNPALGPATSTMATVHVGQVGALHLKPGAGGANTNAGTNTGARPGAGGAKNGAGTSVARAPAVAPATTAVTAAAAAAARGKPAPAADTDVTLLTALVAHANKPSVVAPERSRDIVERHDGDSTADLLARCKQLGLIEGMLCRSRICSGRWESDATCRAPAH